MQSSITVNGVRLAMDGLRALMVGMLIEQIVKAGDTRELRLRGKSADGTALVVVALITPASVYAVELDSTEQSVHDVLSGEMRHRFTENLDALGAEYGFTAFGADGSEDSGDSHEAAS